MNLKDIAIGKIRECDIIREEINSLLKKEQAIRSEIKSIKKQIEEENKHLIGRKAVCSSNDDPSFKDILCVCDHVFCSDDFEVYPKFKHKKKIVHVDFFNWM